MRDFRKLDVWNDSRKLTKEIYSISKKLPEKEKYGLIAQINKSAISIPSNIAEGCAKSSQKDFSRFLEISLGSAYELETQIILCSDLEFLDKKEVNEIIKEIQVLQKRIVSLIKYVKSKI